MNNNMNNNIDSSWNYIIEEYNLNNNDIYLKQLSICSDYSEYYSKIFDDTFLDFKKGYLNICNQKNYNFISNIIFQEFYSYFNGLSII